MLPEISILMPARNASRFIAETIRSILDQDFANWELIIIDDNSNDETIEIAQSFSVEDHRIKIYPNQGTGIIQALADGFEKATGKFITRMDADDLMPQNKLGLFLANHSGSTSEVLTGKVKYFSDHEVSEGYVRYENWLNERIVNHDHFQHVYRECVIASPNWMVHRKAFDKINMHELIYPEDYDLVLKWYQQGFQINAVDEVTHLWREHPARTSRKSLHYQQESFFKLKTNRFIDLELSDQDVVQVLGSGKKALLVTEILAARNRTFFQYDFEGKHGLLSEVSPDLKTILTAWPINEIKQNEIEIFLKSKGLAFGENCWLF